MKRIFICFLVALLVAGCSFNDTVTESSSFEESSAEQSSDNTSSLEESSDGTSSVEEVVIPDEVDGFAGIITVSGKKLLDENGKEYYIKGMAFGNSVFTNPGLPSIYHHSKADFKNLAELGFNSVRFYLNYGLFENDSVTKMLRSPDFAAFLYLIEKNLPDRIWRNPALLLSAGSACRDHT